MTDDRVMLTEDEAVSRLQMHCGCVKAFRHFQDVLMMTIWGESLALDAIKRADILLSTGELSEHLGYGLEVRTGERRVYFATKH